MTCLGYGHELVAGSPGPGLPPVLPHHARVTCPWALTVCVPPEIPVRGIECPVSSLIGAGPSPHISWLGMNFLGSWAGFRGIKDERVEALLST